MRASRAVATVLVGIAGLSLAGCGEKDAAQDESAGTSSRGTTVLEIYDLNEALVREVAYRDEKTALAGSDGDVPAGARLVTAMPDVVPLQVNQEGRFDRSVGVYVLLEGDPLKVRRRDVVSAKAEQPPEPPDEAAADPAKSPSDWHVTVKLGPDAAEEFEALSREVARGGKTAGVPRQIAIVLDGRIVSAPVIDYREYPEGIAGGTIQLTGLTKDEARSIAKRLAA